MVTIASQQPVRPPALLEATTKSTTTWQDDLFALFKHAKDRFPDVAWDLVDEEADDKEVEVWGHKGECRLPLFIPLLYLYCFVRFL